MSESRENSLRHRLLDAWTESCRRVVPFMILNLMLLMQIIVAGYALPEEAQHELRTLFDLGVVQVGAFEVIIYFIFAWLFGPFLSLPVQIGVERTLKRAGLWGEPA